MGTFEDIKNWEISRFLDEKLKKAGVKPKYLHEERVNHLFGTYSRESLKISTFLIRCGKFCIAFPINDRKFPSKTEFLLKEENCLLQLYLLTPFSHIFHLRSVSNTSTILKEYLTDK